MTTDAPPPREHSPERLTGPLDHSVLDQLRIDLEDDDGTAVAGLVDLYLANSRLLLPDLVNALTAGDATTAARLAHALATPTVMLGAHDLGVLLHRVQDVAHDAQVPSAELADLAVTISDEGHRVAAGLAELDATPRT